MTSDQLSYTLKALRHKYACLYDCSAQFFIHIFDVESEPFVYIDIYEQSHNVVVAAYPRDLMPQCWSKADILLLKVTEPLRQDQPIEDYIRENQYYKVLELCI